MTWADDILSALGAPNSSNNVQKLSAWNACEGNAPGQSGLPINNPFNTTLDYAAAPSVNSAGVKSYPSLSAGITATVKTMQAGRYGAVVKNLVSDGPQSEFAGAVGSSGWGTNGSCIARSMNTTLAAATGGSAGADAAAGTGTGVSGCAVAAPKVLGIGGGCILSNSNLKAMKGGLLIAAGGSMLMVGGLILVAYGFQRTKAGGEARQAATAALRPTQAATRAVAGTSPRLEVAPPPPAPNPITRARRTQPERSFPGPNQRPLRYRPRGAASEPRPRRTRDLDDLAF